MKKILLASTALVVSAGFASAEVIIGGDGYMGVAYGAYDGDGIFQTTDTSADERTFDDGTSTNVSNYSFIYDLDVDFSVSMQSDSGLTFGASGDFDDLGQSQGARGWDNSIFISGDFGTITMGDTNGGAEQVIGDLAGVGLSGLGDLNETAFLVTAGAQPAGPVARYDYTVSGIVLSLGLTDDAGYSIGAGYATDLFSVGLAYEAVREGATITLIDPSSTFIRASNSNANAITTSALEDVTHLIGAASVTFSGVTVKGIYGRADQDNVGSVDQYGLSAAAGFGAASVSAYWRQLDTDPDVGDSQTVSFYGIGGAYDLGGGLALEGGIAQYDVDELSATFDGNAVVADFGVSINF